MAERPVPSIEPPDMFPVQRGWLPRATLLSALALAALAAVAVYLSSRPLTFDPASWRTATSGERARMLGSLLRQTDFVGYSRPEVEYYLGVPEFDERIFWYDLGRYDQGSSLDPRGNVGDSSRLFGVFRHDGGGTIKEVVFSHRRPTLGRMAFDSTLWFSDSLADRQQVVTRALGRIRALGLSKSVATNLLGPPDGWRVRSEYNVGRTWFLGGQRALIIEFGGADTVLSSFVAD
jgi:hypothetical protein